MRDREPESFRYFARVEPLALEFLHVNERRIREAAGDDGGARRAMAVMVRVRRATAGVALCFLIPCCLVYGEHGYFFAFLAGFFTTALFGATIGVSVI